MNRNIYGETGCQRVPLLRSTSFSTTITTATTPNHQAAKQLREEVAEREAEAETTFEAQKEAMAVVVEELLEMAYEDRMKFASMKETLVNHKREVGTYSRPRIASQEGV